MAEIWAAAVGVVGIGAGLYESNKSSQNAQDALNAEQNLVNSVGPYQPIDIAGLQAAATQASIDNAKNSLALQTQLQPDVVRSNNALAKTTADQLAQGGRLSPDIANQIAQAARVSGGASGTGGNSAPLTAALIGQSANSLLQQRITNAQQLSALNPAPSVGLDPGTLASATIANSNAANQYALNKAGLGSNLINSTAQVGAANIGTQSSQISSILNSLKGLNTGSTATPNAPAVTSQPPSYLASTGTPYSVVSPGLSYGGTPTASQNGLF